MKPYLTGFLCFCLAFSCFADEEPSDELMLSTPEQLATLSIEPSYLIGGVISPMGGQPLLRQTDLVVKGAQNISLTRIYSSPYIPESFAEYKHCQEEHDKKDLSRHLNRNYKGWQLFPHLKLEWTSVSNVFRLSEPNGATYEFKVVDGKTSLATPLFAINNVSGVSLSGKYDPRNTKITVQDKGERVLVHASDGTQRCYLKISDKGKKHVFLLQKEILPNGKILKYHYDNQSRLLSLESLDPKESHVYASLTMTGSDENDYHVVSSSGLTADYHFERWLIRGKIKEKEKGYHFKEEFNRLSPPILSAVSAPIFREETMTHSPHFLLESYSGKDQIFHAHYKIFGNDPHYRVQRLSLPVGPKGSFEPVYEMHYHPPIPGEKEGFTEVKNSDGTSIVYNFSKNLLITSLQFFSSDGILKKEKLFSWDEHQWLTSIEIKDGEGNLFSKTAYGYDEFGNPILEIFTGDLIGNGKVDNYRIKKEFSKDGLHLLLKEEHENGKMVCYTYLLNTDLLTSKVIYENEQMIQREILSYDVSNNLIQTIFEAGDGLQKTFTNYILRQNPPFLHLPEWIEEKYWEEGVEKLLMRKHLIYDTHGNITEEAIYNANNEFVYTLYFERNERGDLTSETNALGQKADYAYDQRGHRNLEKNFSGQVHKSTHYDPKGRIVQQSEVGCDGCTKKIGFEYDFQDRLIKKTDLFQNATFYTYDPLVNKVMLTEFPAITSQEGVAVIPKIGAVYDSLGRKVSETDANGNRKSYRYNAYGSCTEIHYPNGSQERFTYAKDGSLISHLDQEGRITSYRRDILGRVLSKIVSSDTNEMLAQETFSYCGFQLLTKIDGEGHKAHYIYDGAGRKIKQERAGREVTFSYDLLGRLATVCKHNGDNTLLIHYIYDLEGRLLTEIKTDILNTILFRINYRYDADGNQSTVIRFINGQQCMDTFDYDSFGRRTCHKDSRLNLYQKSYNENFFNSLGQRVLQITSTDPHCITTLETFDTLNRLVKKETLNSEKIPLASEEYIYDSQGNLIIKKDSVYENDSLKSTQIIHNTYSPTHCKDSQTMGYGTKDARATHYTYTPSGKLATKTLPSGTTLFYEYNPLGYLSQVCSSDHLILHSFSYDNLGNLKVAADEFQNKVIHRELDPFGNVIQERFPSGLVVNKQYDNLNRLTLLQVGDGEVSYKYDPLYLRKVIRTTLEKKYSHLYENYDEAGNLLSELLIGNLGRITHKIDIQGKKTAITSPYFTQKNTYDAVGNLIESDVNSEITHYCYDDLSQMSSEISHSSTFYTHDSLYNRIEENNESSEFNALNQNVLESYDHNGNQISLDPYQFTFDPLNQLIEATSQEKKMTFTYDPLGRRIEKTVFEMSENEWIETYQEHYLYHGHDEIGSFSKNQLKTFRVLGLRENHSPKTIAIELEQEVFAPFVDVQDNICSLIRLDSKLANTYRFSAFGEKKQISEALFNPWQFASKRLDPELNLICFGKRYYNPKTARWLSPDPAETRDSSNLYQYAFNNPFRYKDPNGEFVIAIPLLFWGSSISWASISAIVMPIIYGSVAGGVAYGGYKAVEALNKNVDDVYAEKRHTPDQEAIRDLVKGSEKKGISNADAETLLEWAEEYDFPRRDDRGETHWKARDGIDHIHIGPKPIAVNDYKGNS